MTLKASMEADMDAFLNTDEFAVNAVFSGSGETIKVIMDKDIDTETGTLVDMFIVSLGDVDGIQPNDTFTIGSKTYFNASSNPVSIDGLMATFRVNT